jgi:hypothetical protein
MKNYTILVFHRFPLAIQWKSKRYFGFLAIHMAKWMMMMVGSEAGRAEAFPFNSPHRPHRFPT